MKGERYVLKSNVLPGGDAAAGAVAAINLEAANSLTNAQPGTQSIKWHKRRYRRMTHKIQVSSHSSQ